MRCESALLALVTLLGSRAGAPRCRVRSRRRSGGLWEVSRSATRPQSRRASASPRPTCWPSSSIASGRCTRKVICPTRAPRRVISYTCAGGRLRPVEDDADHAAHAADRYAGHLRQPAVPLSSFMPAASAIVLGSVKPVFNHSSAMEVSRALLRHAFLPIGPLGPTPGPPVWAALFFCPGRALDAARHEQSSVNNKAEGGRPAFGRARLDGLRGTGARGRVCRAGADDRL